MLLSRSLSCAAYLRLVIVIRGPLARRAWLFKANDFCQRERVCVCVGLLLYFFRRARGPLFLSRGCPSLIGSRGAIGCEQVYIYGRERERGNWNALFERDAGVFGMEREEGCEEEEDDGRSVLNIDILRDVAARWGAITKYWVLLVLVGIWLKWVIRLSI